MARHRLVTWLQRVLLAVAAVSLVFFAWSWLDSNVYQWLQERRLHDAIAGKTFGELRRPAAEPRAAAGAAATRREISRSGVIGRIEIPRLGVSAVVAEGTTPRVLRRAVGHLSETALPGEPGNVALAGHRDSFFRRLSGVKSGDRVRITTPDGVTEYLVDTHRIVGPEDVEVLKNSSVPTLTLITCFPFHYIGPAPERFVVQARQIGTNISPSGSPGRVNAPGAKAPSGTASILPASPADFQSLLNPTT